MNNRLSSNMKTKMKDKTQTNLIMKNKNKQDEEQLNEFEMKLNQYMDNEHEQ